MDNMWFFTWIFRFGLFHVIGNKSGEERETLFEAFARYWFERIFTAETKTEIACAISFPDMAWWSDCLNPQSGDNDTGDYDEQGSQNHGRVFHDKFLTILWLVGDEMHLFYIAFRLEVSLVLTLKTILLPFFQKG